MTTHRLTGPLSRARGVIGREPKADERYVLEYDAVAERRIHMIGVRRPLTVTWVADGEVTRRETLSPWTGTASAPADTVIESAAGGESR